MMESRLYQSQPEPGSPNPTDQVHWASILQLGISTLALLGLWGLGLVFALLGLVDQFSSPGIDGTPMLLVASGLGFFGFLVLPSIGYSLGQVINRPFQLPAWLRLSTLWRTILLFPLVLLAGHLVVTQTSFSWLLLPPIHLLALGLPVLFILWIGARGISNGNIQRMWGVFGAGLVVGPVIILLVEFLALIMVVLLAVVFIASQPDRLAELYDLAEQLQYMQDDPFLALDLVEPYLYRPQVVLSVFLFAAGLVPVIEELFKPIGVWFLGREATPAQGFVAGLLSGAGYALFENLALSSQSGEWAFAVTARAGTSLLHIITAGLVGWALVVSWRRRKYLWAVGAYLAAVIIHGLWNGLTLLTLVNALNAPEAAYLEVFGSLATLAPFGLGALAIGSLALLVYLNRTHQDLETPESPGSPPVSAPVEGTPTKIR